MSERWPVNGGQMVGRGDPFWTLNVEGAVVHHICERVLVDDTRPLWRYLLEGDRLYASHDCYGTEAEARARAKSLAEVFRAAASGLDGGGGG